MPDLTNKKKEQLCNLVVRKEKKKEKTQTTKKTWKDKMRNWKWNYYYNPQWNVSLSTVIFPDHLTFIIIIKWDGQIGARAKAIKKWP